MKIEHIAIYVKNIEQSAEFFEKFFGGKRSALHTINSRGYSSCFVSFPEGASVELINVPTLGDISPRLACGYAHIAFSLGPREAVDALTSRLVDEGFELNDYPKDTWNGHYESSVFDRDGNIIEITD